MAEAFKASWVVKEAKRRFLIRRATNKKRNSAVYVQEKIQAEARQRAGALESAIVAEAKKQETEAKAVCGKCNGAGQTISRKKKRKVCPDCGGSGRKIE